MQAGESLKSFYCFTGVWRAMSLSAGEIAALRGMVERFSPSRGTAGRRADERAADGAGGENADGAQRGGGAGAAAGKHSPGAEEAVVLPALVQVCRSGGDDSIAIAQYLFVVEEHRFGALTRK